MNTGLLSLALGKLHYTRAISFFLLFNLCHSASFPLYPLFIKIYIYINLLYYSIARSFAKVSSETINETVLFIYFFIIRRTECTYWIFATKMDRSHANCNFVLSSRVNWFTLVDTRSLSSFTVKTLSYTVGSLYSAIRHDFPRVTRTTLFSGNSSSRLLLFILFLLLPFFPCVFPPRCSTRTPYFPSRCRRVDDSRRRFPIKAESDRILANRKNASVRIFFDRISWSKIRLGSA